MTAKGEVSSVLEAASPASGPRSPVSKDGCGDRRARASLLETDLEMGQFQAPCCSVIL